MGNLKNCACGVKFSSDRASNVASFFQLVPWYSHVDASALYGCHLKSYFSTVLMEKCDAEGWKV